MIAETPPPTLPCCDLFCMEPAEFEVTGGSGHFEDGMLACGNHVGTMFGTFEWLEQPNQQWVVSLLPKQVV